MPSFCSRNATSYHQSNRQLLSDLSYLRLSHLPLIVLSVVAVAQVQISPVNPSVTAGKTLTFTATGGPVSWSVTPPRGTVSTSGVYTAPTGITTAETVSITASSTGTPSTSATTTVTVYPAVQFTVTPTKVTLTAPATRQFTGTVTGPSDTGVIWSLENPVGTIGQDGLYTSPASVSALQQTEVVVTSRANPLASFRTTVKVYPNVTVQMSPTKATLIAAQTQAFAATVTGDTTNSGVTWSVSPALGTVTPNGVYTAPSSVTATQTTRVYARSVANPNRYASALVTLNPTSSSVTVSPATVSLQAGQTQAITATVTGLPSTGVTWSLTPNVGTLSTSGNTAVYTAPSTISDNRQIEVRATSMADPNYFASATIALLAGVTVSVSPSTVELSPGAGHQFSAAVAGTANTGVNWSLSSQVGTITPSGSYAAPAGIDETTAVTVKASSVQDPRANGTAVVTIVPKLVVRVDSTGVKSIAYRGQEFLLQGQGLPAVVQMFLRNNTTGAITAAPTSPVSTSVDSGAKTITTVYSWGKLVLSYQAVSDRMKLGISLTNTTSDSSLERYWLFPLGIQFPSAVTNFSDSFRSNIDSPSVLPWTHATGTVALVNEDVVRPLGLGFWQAESPAATKWHFYIQTDKISGMTTPRIVRPIPAGTTDTMSLSLRFAEKALTAEAIAPDIIERYRNTFPPAITPPIRKPIAQLMTTGRFRPNFAKNPRGWLNDPNIDVTTASGIAAFQTRLLSWADGAVTEMLRVGAQGGILWDMEGQQFDQAYIGDPTQLEALAPELVGVLDNFVQRFRAAGLKIGFTLRPQVFTSQTGIANVSGNQVTWVSGTPFSASWVGQPAGGILFIGGQNYTIQSVQSSTSLTLTATPTKTGANLPFAYPLHVNPTDPGAVLKAKVKYAVDRWGASLFYIDSNLEWDGTINQADTIKGILDSYPNVMVFPEWKNTRHFAYSYPYLDSTLGPSYHRTDDNVLAVYPTAASLVNIPGDPLPIKDSLVQSVKQGDILLFGGWYRHPANDVVIQIYAEANR